MQKNIKDMEENVTPTEINILKALQGMAGSTFILFSDELGHLKKFPTSHVVKICLNLEVLKLSDDESIWDITLIDGEYIEDPTREKEEDEGTINYPAIDFMFL